MFELNKLDLRLELFASWLCAREDVVVGLLGSWLRSPLVVWLSDVCGSACWIDHQCFGLVALPLRAPLPDWARFFLARTERYGGFHEATGAEVFDLLADLERCLLIAF
jgi:hypothetical protein